MPRATKLQRISDDIELGGVLRLYFSCPASGISRAAPVLADRIVQAMSSSCLLRPAARTFPFSARAVSVSAASPVGQPGSIAI
jgi:hypothetical protein